MQPRIEEEIQLLRARYPLLEYHSEGNWVRIKDYKLPPGWNQSTTDVAFQIVPPPAAPYGIYAASGLLFNAQKPNNYSDPANNVPFPGQWAIFSWAPGDGEWCPAQTAAAGSNYVMWVVGFRERFREGL